MAENIIPLSMWKMFTETIPDLMKMENEEWIQKLSNMITSKEYSNIFVFSKDPTLSYEQYKEIADKYKAFTTWLLGRFFYMLNCEKLSPIHDIAISVQISILDQLSKTLSYVYYEFVSEYENVLHSLTDYLQKPNGKLQLNAFIPKVDDTSNIDIDLSVVPAEIQSESQCCSMIIRILRIFSYIYDTVFILYKFNENNNRFFDDLIYLLSNSTIKVKFAVLNIFVILISKDTVEDEMFDSLQTKIRSMFVIFEQIIYDIYCGKICLEKKDVESFTILLTTFLGAAHKKKMDPEKLYKIASFISVKTTDREDQISLPKESHTIMCMILESKTSVTNNAQVKQNVKSAIEQNNVLIIINYKTEIIKNIKEYHKENNKRCKNIKVFDREVSEVWYTLHEELMSKFVQCKCSTICGVKRLISFINDLSTIVFKCHIELSPFLMENSVSLMFFNESQLFFNLLTKLEEHRTSCSTNLEDSLYLKLFSLFPVLTNSKNCDIIFSILSYQFAKSVYKGNKQAMPNNFIGTSDTNAFKKLINNLYTFLSVENINSCTAIENLNRFFQILSSGLLLDLNQFHLQSIEPILYQIMENLMKSNTDNTLFCLAMDSILHACTIFSDTDNFVSKIITPCVASSNKSFQKMLLKFIKILVCISHSNYMKALKWNQKELKLEIIFFCNKCHLQSYEGTSKKEDFLKDYFDDSDLVKVLEFSKSGIDLSSIIPNLLNFVLNVLSSGDSELKIEAIETFPSFSNHVIKFHSVIAARIWLKAAGDGDKNVRKKFSEVIFETLKHGQESNILSNEAKKEVIDATLESLMELTKKSLKFSDFELQNTILSVIEEISSLKCDQMLLPIMDILLYFIIFPTSKYSPIAINRFFTLAKKYNTNSELLYLQYKKDLCKTITHLCAVNLQVINYTLEESLSKISLVLGFHGTKDFVSQACHYLLPYFVAKAVQMPKVSKLIEEVARLCDLELSELLASKYGNIFLHIFLNETKECLEKCMKYLEQKTGLSGAALRKRNFRIILNELLLNFHSKRQKVLLALELLSSEDKDNATNAANIPDYLQSQFLGILLYFDMKLIDPNCTSKDEILKSLAAIFQFMGSRHVTPLRFKIVAMLTTANCEKYPELNCQVWECFVKSCEIEMLGPQLARIVVCLLPLIQHCPTEVNRILRYLVVENELYVSEHIKDLFFVNDDGVDESVLSVIKHYLITKSRENLKSKIKQFLQYLKHETIEVRVQGFKHLKLIMEDSRKELDQMILGYNGIDTVIVELIDTLSLGCQDQDETVRLACGDLIGELGAVEPSHLPRRYAQDTKSFTFFINGDAFLVSTLNELTKAFQAEKNTQNTDRFALAIQEILKAYEISPEESSERNSIWKEFSEAQQQIMFPFLSSRYMIAQTPSNSYPCPIYGSNMGSSFESWLYNWTCSVISDLPSDKKSILELCLPSMKLNQRILMHFLPHIFLHSLIEGKDGSSEKCYLELMAVISSANSKKSVDAKVLNMRPLPLPGITTQRASGDTDDEKQTQCLKIIFILLNFLDRWLREWQWQKGLKGRSNRNFQDVKNYCDRFCKLNLAKSNYQCEEYPRALMYIEDYVTENQDELYNNLAFLAEIYAQLDEPDGVAGVSALQHSEPSIDQRILALEVAGKLADAASCYEKITPPLKLHHLQGLIQCYLDLDNVNTALNFAQGAVDLQPEFGNMLLELQAEPLWRLGRYDELGSLLKKRDLASNKSWGVQIGKALIQFKQGKQDEFKNVLQVLKHQQVENFGTASLEQGTYQHGYSYISRLHVLAELEQVEKSIHELLLKPNDKNSIEKIMKQLMNEWEMRIKVVQESARIIEPLLCLRRVAVELAKNVLNEGAPQAVPFLDALLGELWLRSARIARASGNYQQAYTYTLKAEGYAPSKLFIEKAELHWLREEHELALTTLKRGVDLILPSGCSTQALSGLGLEQRKLCAEAKLLIASYNDEVSNVDTEVNIQHYKEAVEVYKEWEKSLVYLAQYYDRIFQQYNEEERDAKSSDMQLHMINYFGKSLLYGTTYVYQSMPRLLSIWFDYGTRLLDVTSSPVREERKGYLLKMTKLIDSFLERLPSFIFLTALSQLVSRICHPQKEVYIELKSIIIKLLLEYPQQTLWMIISVIKSDYAVRSKRCAEILNDPRLRTGPMTKLIRDFTALAEKLIELCNKEIAGDVHVTSVSLLLRTLPRMLSKGDFSEIMVPTYRFRKLVLPNPDFESSEHNPFPNHYVHIVGIDDEVTILTSLQRPRKISFRGSDGKSYTQMLKPKDDLRKDFRLMEFNDIVNQFLAREPESRQRRLNIRLYSVVPLNEECGLIEWVPNLVGFRPILMNIYQQKGLGMKGKELKEVCCVLKDPLAKKREVFTNVLLRRHPPVLGEWFRKTFPDAQNWLTARTAYIRTTAVMSMVGYILGLGDRHGENISLDSLCGDIVHVDFNCLFNKGESFEWPERVPFRLTQNMVAAMGPLGVEGIFRKSCACTLKVLRENSTTLMSTVTPFVYDPLVHWPRNAPSSHAHNAERTNEQAVEHIKNIELRLQGIMKSRTRNFSIPVSLSVEGQANNLINEAMSVDNLCQMYIGWGPYL